MDLLDTWIRKLARPASRLILTNDLRSTDPETTWFGRVTLGTPGEEWPIADGRLMWPLLQIVVKELPHRPAALDDLALIRVFVNPAYTGQSDSGGAYFCERKGVSGGPCLVRTSSKLERIEEIVQPNHESSIRPALGSWERIEMDYPSYDDLPADLPDSLRGEYSDHLETGHIGTHDGTKVGGWPFTVQSEIYWAPNNEHPHKPEYVFQIDSDYKRGWAWGDSGLAYFGRGTGKHRDKWATEWQCY